MLLFTNKQTNKAVFSTGVKFSGNSVALFCNFANFFSVWLRDSWMLMSASEMGLLSDPG